MSDPEEIFSHCDRKLVNYEDPNLNVGVPVFSINGNHDDPSIINNLQKKIYFLPELTLINKNIFPGYGAVGSIDVLSATGLINYFGKWTDATQVTIPPLLLRKGLTTVALYGLSYMNDQRLSRLMRADKVIKSVNLHKSTI